MNINNWTIGRRIVTGFATLLIITLALGGFALDRAMSLKQNIFDLGGNTMPSLNLQAAILNAVQDKMIAIQQLNDTLTPERRAALTKILAEATARAVDELKKYEALLSDEKDKTLWTEACKANEEFTVQIEKTVELFSANDPAALSKHLQGVLDPAYERAVGAVDANLNYNIDWGQAAANRGEANADSAIFYISIALGIAAVVAIFVAWQVTSSTNKALHDLAANLDRGSLQTASAARQVSMASNQLSSGSSEQASSVEETSSALEEMSSMIRATADNAQKAKSLASEARSEAETGTGIMDEMMQAMKAIDTSSAEVAKIVKNIDEIAFQTNILALNAAVEAARAGEAGAGFAVVADEVRSLAQRSAAAAKETAEKIEAAIANSRSGSICSTKVGESLKLIAEKVSSTDSLVADIATAASEQAQGIQQVNNAMSQMDKVTQGNAASAEESASAAEELDSQAETMKDLVGELRKLVGGSSHIEEAHANIRTKPTHPSSHQQSSRPAGKPSRSIPMPGDSAESDDFRNF
jgi:methyl-accepting chemotaxis protein